MTTTVTVTRPTITTKTKRKQPLMTLLEKPRNLPNHQKSARNPRSTTKEIQATMRKTGTREATKPKGIMLVGMTTTRMTTTRTTTRTIPTEHRNDKRPIPRLTMPLPPNIHRMRAMLNEKRTHRDRNRNRNPLFLPENSTASVAIGFASTTPMEVSTDLRLPLWRTAWRRSIDTGNRGTCCGWPVWGSPTRTCTPASISSATPS
mmetsp:Transcript_5847/g.16656  ORF Transcript_5847/g.16656 Transcript_5847/m.16656 type:complete len:204 (+) Transcript_5847:671-1282(+)